MKNLLLIIAAFVATAVSAQDLSVNIQEVWEGVLGVPDDVFVMEVINIEPNVKAWDEHGGDPAEMEYAIVATYSDRLSHTWTEQGVYVVFGMKDGNIFGQNTYFIITEKYVDYVISKVPGVLIENTFVRTDIEYLCEDHPVIVCVK
tara:strand:+ start:810 stop:1247 length:438 start_codon:yes stop_codon:yes gene_type:complete